jgi:erythromycin esterase
MIQHMVQQLDFRVLAIEANFSTAQAINDYILGGSGTAVEAVQNFSGWVYNNQEFVQLLEWLRNYNSGQSSANKVRFYGFDAQQADAGAVRVQKFISENDPSYLSNFNSTAEPFLNDFAELLQYDLGQLEKMISGFVAQYQTRWSTITSYLQTNKAALVAKSGSREYELTLRHWEIVKQTFNQYVYISDELKANNFRDAYMADNVDWIQKFEGNRKMIVWAHVGHAGNDNSLTTQMGYLLKQNYQTKYYTIGFFTNGGSVRVVDLDKKALGVTKIDPKPEHVITQAFALGKWSQFFLPVSAVNANVELSKLFSTPQKVYFIGSTLEKSTVEQKLGVYYDAIVFIEKTTAVKPN